MFKLIKYLKNPSSSANLKVKQKAFKYILLCDKLYEWSTKGLNLKCLDKCEFMKVMIKVHNGVCESHKSSPKMRWLIHGYGYYWPTMATDYISYAKGCTAC